MSGNNTVRFSPSHQVSKETSSESVKASFGESSESEELEKALPGTVVKEIKVEIVKI